MKERKNLNFYAGIFRCPTFLHLASAECDARNLNEPSGDVKPLFDVS